MIPIARPVITDDEIARVEDVLRSGRLVSGPVVKEFEDDFARYCRTDHAVAVSNGTAALELAVNACGIDGEVITTPFSFVSSSNCILLAGAKPVFADIDPDTFNISPDSILERITERTKAVLAVHLYGQPCDMGAIMDICEDRGLVLIEDCAQAAGAEYSGKKVGSFGHVGCFSFYATKNMTTGEGGMVTTNDSSLARKIKELSDVGQSRKYFHTSIGYNLRMTEVEAAIGISQLKRLDGLDESRIRNAEIITKGIWGMEGITAPKVDSKSKHVFHQYVIKSERRDELQKYLFRNGIETAVHYPMPITKQPVYENLGYGSVAVPNADQASKKVLSLPVHPSLRKDELEKIVEKVKSFSV